MVITKLHFISLFFILQRIHTTIWIWKSLQKSILFLFTKNFNRNFKKKLWLLKWNQNNKITFVVSPKHSLQFMLQNNYIYPHFKTMCLRIIPFPQNLHLWEVLSHHQHDSKPNKNSKLKTFNVQSSIPIFNALFIQNNVVSLPL
jgi:hypothetical protein